MKITAKVKYIIIVIVVLVSISILLKFIFYNNPKQNITDQLASQMIQKKDVKEIQTYTNAINETKHKVKPVEKAKQTPEIAKKDDQLKEAISWLDSLDNDSQIETKSETPAELLQRWYRTQNTPEFQAYAHNLIDPLLSGEDIELSSKIKELENKEKKLMADLETVSDDQKSKIQLELENIRANLWETRVIRSEKLTLIADAIWSVHLKYFTQNELLSVREEMRRTQRPSSLPTNQNRYRDRMIKTEAITRLKARGWIPANPDESWY